MIDAKVIFRKCLVKILQKICTSFIYVTWNTNKDDRAHLSHFLYLLLSFDHAAWTISMVGPKKSSVSIIGNWLFKMDWNSLYKRQTFFFLFIPPRCINPNALKNFYPTSLILPNVWCKHHGYFSLQLTRCMYKSWVVPSSLWCWLGDSRQYPPYWWLSPETAGLEPTPWSCSPQHRLYTRSQYTSPQ